MFWIEVLVQISYTKFSIFYSAELSVLVSKCDVSLRQYFGNPVKMIISVADFVKIHMRTRAFRNSNMSEE